MISHLDFATDMHQARIDKGITSRKLAKDLNVDRMQIIDIERARAATLV